MKLSVVILNYNVRYFLELCLKSVEAALATIDSEIIVVDNNSSDESCKMVKQLFPEVLLIENNENTGFSRGNNIGVAKASGDYVCILNPDTVVAEDTFTRLLKFADNTQNLGILGCKLIDGSGNYLPESKRNIPTPAVSFKKIIGFDKSYYANIVNTNAIGRVDILVGAFMLMKRALYNDVKGFDEDYFMYGEDIDLSYRVVKKGYHNYYNGEVTIIHFKGESTPKNAEYLKRFYNAMRIFYRKHFKKNPVFDVLVAIGLKIIPMFHSFEGKNNANLNRSKEIIFDNNQLSFKEIIASYEEGSGTFKIQPKNSNFIIGSNSSKKIGDVRILNDFN